MRSLKPGKSIGKARVIQNKIYGQQQDNKGQKEEKLSTY